MAGTSILVLSFINTLTPEAKAAATAAPPEIKWHNTCCDSGDGAAPALHTHGYSQNLVNSQRGTCGLCWGGASLGSHSDSSTVPACAPRAGTATTSSLVLPVQQARLVRTES